MNSVADQHSEVSSFRAKLLVSMMVVTAAITAAALYAANKDAASDAERELRREFEGELSTRHFVQEIHHAALVERCRTLAAKPRIHAALEDDAKDLLYLSAREELHDIIAPDSATKLAKGERSIRAQYYRFLDSNGEVIPAPERHDAGRLARADEERLSLGRLPVTHQVGYFPRTLPSGQVTVDEVITTPIISQENGTTISAIVLGFKSDSSLSAPRESGIHNGFWLDGKLHLPALDTATRAAVGEEIGRAISASSHDEESLDVAVDGVPHLLFFKQLNPGSLFPRAYEVSIYPLTALIEKQRLRFWQVLGAGAALMLGGLVATHCIARKLSVPVENLAASRKQLQETLNDLRATERELIQSEKMASLGILTGGIMHELNNPLNFAKSALFVLDRRTGRLPADTKNGLDEVLGDLKEGLNRISTIVSDLRVFCSPESVLASACPVVEPLQSAVRMLAAFLNEARITLRVDVPEETLVRGDRNQLVLVFVNLIKNAMDAHLERQPFDPARAHIWISAKARGEHVEMRFRDDGPGIEPANLPKLFDPFFTTKPPGQGTGLGLSTVYRIISAHGGSITAQSEPGRGAEFVLQLPKAVPPIVSVPSAAEPALSA